MAEEKTVANLSEEKVEEVKEEANIMETIVHDENAEVVTLRKLLEAGVHYGHQTKRWNPKMKLHHRFKQIKRCFNRSL